MQPWPDAEFGPANRKKSRKNKDGNFWQKKAREISPRFNLQRRNRGETIKKQLLHLNEYGLSRPTVTLSTLFMLLGIIFVKNCRCRANKMFISEHQRYTGPATGNSAICPEHACTSGAARAPSRGPSWRSAGRPRAEIGRASCRERV